MSDGVGEVTKAGVTLSDGLGVAVSDGAGVTVPVGVGVGDISAVCDGLGDAVSAGVSLGVGLTVTEGEGEASVVGSLAKATPGSSIWATNITLAIMLRPPRGIFMVHTPCMQVKDNNLKINKLRDG